MFEPSDLPRVFALPPGVDFARSLIDGLRGRLDGHGPDAMARVQLIVNTRRAARRLREIFDTGPACLLPRISLITDLGEKWALPELPDPVAPLRRRLELMQLVSALLEQQPELAPRSTALDLASSLAALMDEMHGEGVTPDAIDALDVSDQSGHWERIRAFLGILRPYFDTAHSAPDIETRQRLVVDALIDRWSQMPPAHPIILAGSTGSRGATQMLMRAISRLPQGAVVLPGFDFDMPDHAWDVLDDQLFSEDHPQYRYHAFLRALDLRPDQVARWTDDTPAVPARNRLLSLALRPAPVTDQWLSEGPGLAKDIAPATRGITLLEAPHPRTEALCIAMALRDAAEHGRRAALITPDRTLTRQVAAALDQWGIRPDDSAGEPLHLSATGRFLRHVAELFRNRLTADALLTLLKHPLTHSGAERGPHLRLTRELELHLRRNGPPYPDAMDFANWAAGERDPMAQSWARWLGEAFCEQEQAGPSPLGDWVRRHRTHAEMIAAGSQGTPEDGLAANLWSREDGQQAHAALRELSENADAAGAVSASDFASILHNVLSGREVRDPLTPHPNILIWGTLEARIQSADLIILAGLNEGSWPETPAPDPWLNRSLRMQAGLLLPERRVGLSAHDFQQVACSADVWLSRALRSNDAETVPSRWLNRLLNLLSGLHAQGGPAAVEEMRARGQDWFRRAQLLEEPGTTPRAARPAPCPPALARPQKLSVTEIQRLIRDPYAIYARHVLRLRPLDPLMREPDALLRGIVLHRVLEIFIRDTRDDPSRRTRDELLARTHAILQEEVPWASARALWLARIEAVADQFLRSEERRRRAGDPADLEAKGALVLTDPPFTLTAQADRLDLDAAGNILLYDYKTGTPPTQRQQRHYDKQLLLEAVIAEQAGFGSVAPAPVLCATYLGLGPGAPEVEAPLGEIPASIVLIEFRSLIAAYADPATAYVSRRAMHTSAQGGDYDQLARFGEWDITTEPHREALP